MNRRPVLIVVLIASLSAAATPAAPPGTQRAPEMKTLRVRAAATTRPALQYALMPDARDIEPGDAAALYLMAINAAARSMPNVATQPARGEGAAVWPGDLLDVPLDKLRLKQALDLLGNCAGAIDYLDRAARREHCDLQLNYRKTGMNTQMPYLNDIHYVGQILALRARVQVVSKDYAGAAHTLASGLALARHLQEHAPLVQHLVAIGNASIMLDRVQEWIESDGSPNVYWPLASLPQPLVDPGSVPGVERALVEGSLDLRKAAAGELPAEQRPQFWRRVQTVITIGPFRDQRDQSESSFVGAAIGAAAAYPQARQYLIARGVSAQRVDAMPADAVLGRFYAVKYLELFDETYKAWNLPYPESAAAMRQAQQEIVRERRAFPSNLLQVLLPAVRQARLQYARLDRKVALLRCVEVLRARAAADGAFPADLYAGGDLPVPNDPVTGKPFGYSLEAGVATIDATAPPENPCYHLIYRIELVR